MLDIQITVDNYLSLSKFELLETVFDNWLIISIGRWSNGDWVPFVSANIELYHYSLFLQKSCPQGSNQEIILAR